MKKDIMRSLEVALKYLEKEWQRSGEKKTRIHVEDEDMFMAVQRITQYVKDKEKIHKNIEDISFEESLQMSHENYILLRVARKYKKICDKIQKKGLGRDFIELDIEETKALMKILPELEEEETHG